MPAVPDVPKAVDKALAAFPAAAQRKLLKLRTLIYQTAARNPEIGQLQETLKWGEPAYLPTKPRTGTTVRMGWSEKSPDEVKLFVHCQTTLVDTYRTLVGDKLSFEGNRAIVIPIRGSLPKAELKLCVEAALTYHLQKRKPARAG